MKTTTTLSFLSLVLYYVPGVQADTFGIGPNTFDIEFVTIGNAGNAADNTGTPNPAGSVPYEYRMAKYEISEDMLNKMHALGGQLLTHDNRGANKPATSITWFEAAQFVNWINAMSGSTPAYKVDSSGDFQLWQPGDEGYDPDNLFRNSMACYFLPSVDEWYKAAYYDPVAAVYYDYPTGSDSMPDGIDFPNDPTFDAVYGEGYDNAEPYEITNVGLLSPYGTAGQGGNVREWEETEFDLLNDTIGGNRHERGGSWLNSAPSLLASVDGGSDIQATYEAIHRGFRVASYCVSPQLMPGDYDYDQDGDGFDFLIWQRGELPQPYSASDLYLWEQNFGNVLLPLPLATANVPEPSALLLGALASIGLILHRRSHS